MLARIGRFVSYVLTPSLYMLALHGGAIARDGRDFAFGRPTGLAIVSTKQHDAKGHFLTYGGSKEGPADNWHIYQWNTGGDLGDLVLDKTTKDWKAKTAMSAVAWHPARDGGKPQRVALTQDGKSLPCASGEFDLGMEPNDWSDANRPVSYPQATRESPTLDKMADFTFAGSYTLKALRPAGGHQSCEVNQGGSSISVQARTTTAPLQFFYYNIHVSFLCTEGGRPSPGYLGCRQRVEHPMPSWFWTGPQGPGKSCAADGTCRWGLDDPIAQYGTSYITDHGPHALRLDILPRLKELIAAGKFGNDRDLRHWIISGGGFGQAIWGDVYLATTFEGFVPSYAPR